jgi:release factor glutamine methyltransferase
MTIGEIYDRMTDRLKAVYDQREAASVTGLVLESRLGIRRIDRILRKSESLSAPQEAQLQSDLLALLQNKPVQYVLGEAWFDGLLLKVDGHVLIPRPETEELVHWVVDGVKTKSKAKSNSRTPAILDIGTGSGCIPIALKKHLPHVNIQALDVSPQALMLAQDNARRIQTDIGFLLLDFLDEATWSTLPGYDVIISNPPYIPDSEKSGIHARVLGNEPHLALFVPDNDPLLFYKKIARFSRTHLCAEGALYIEINESSGDSTMQLLKEEGFTQIILQRDLQGKDRMICAME